MIDLNYDDFTLVQPSPLSELLDSKGQKSFRVVMKDGELIELTTLLEHPEATVPSIRGNDYISMRDAAMHLRHGYFWLSRHWERLGLRPKRIGRVLFFRRSDLDALIDRQRPLGTSRGKKVIGVLRA